MAQARRSSRQAGHGQGTSDGAGAPPTATTNAVDWECVEHDYRAGILSVREMASAYRVSHVAILKRAKKYGWERDLSAKIQAKAEAMVTSALVTGSVTDRELLVTERQIIEANAQRIAEVRSEHRTDISRARGIVRALMCSLDAHGGELSLQQRADVAKKLLEATRIVVQIEREAYGIDTAGPEDDGKAKSAVQPDKTLARRFALAMYLGLQAANESNSKAADAA